MTPWLIANFLRSILAGDETNDGDLIPISEADMARNGDTTLKLRDRDTGKEYLLKVTAL